MDEKVWEAVDRYVEDVVVRPDPILESVRKESERAGLPPINVTANQGKLLMLLAKAKGARRILEVGTLGGYSTVWLARALPRGGRLVTLEVEPVHARVAAANVASAGLGKVVDVRLGPALESLWRMAREGEAPFDFFFIDADKENNAEYFRWALKMSRPGSLIVVDNVVRGGDVLDAESADLAVQGTRKLNELLGSDRRVAATEIQTVGSKGYDGFAVALVLS